jgi:hypothetical protein
VYPSPANIARRFGKFGAFAGAAPQPRLTKSVHPCKAAKVTNASAMITVLSPSIFVLLLGLPAESHVHRALSWREKTPKLREALFIPDAEGYF